MTNRVSIDTEDVLSLGEIATHHERSERALAEYFSTPSPHFARANPGLSPMEVDAMRDAAFLELDHSSSMSVMASIEATLRIDYLTRAYDKWKDPLSRSMRELYKTKGSRAALVDDILQTWRNDSSVPKILISETASAFNYRHWLAHGRYWTKKFGRRYDYLTVSGIAQELIDEMDQQNSV